MVVTMTGGRLDESKVEDRRVRVWLLSLKLDVL